MSRPRDQLLQYADGSLVQAEAVRLEEHLRGCPSCRAEVREVRSSLVQLVESLPAAGLPGGVWQLVLDRIRRGRRRARAGARLALAAIALVVLTSGLWMARDYGRTARMAEHSETVARWLASDEVTRIGLGIYPSGGYGSVLVRPDGRTLFVLSELPDSGHSYQAWGHLNGEAASLGVFQQPVFEVHSGGFDAIGVSLEPLGGSPEPTHPLGRAQLP